MGIQELIQIAYQCRSLLGEIPQSNKTISLIHRIDQQLAQYSSAKIDKRSFVDIRRSYSRSKSKRKIFEVVSKQVTPVKKIIGIKSSNSEILSPKADEFIELSKSNSQVSQISLASVRLHIDSKIENDFEPLSHSTIMVNNSFDNHNLLLNQTKTQKGAQIILKTKQSQTEIQIDDFFIIDYNFERKQYEILPRRQNYHNKCSILNQLQVQYSNNSKQHHQGTKLSMLKKHSSGQKHAINPFQQIIHNNSNRSLSTSSIINGSQLSMDSIILKSIDQYSIQAQIDSSKSRVYNLGIEKDEKKIDELYEIRDVIMNLVLDTTPENHIKEIKPTSSMTDLLKLTTNPSSKNKTLEHIIIPSCLEIRTIQNSNNCNKYTHVIKTHQGISYGLRYFQCERFYVIIQRNKNYLHIQSIIQTLIKKAYEIRVKRERQVDNVFYSNIRKYIQQVICLVKQISLIPKYRLGELSKMKNTQFMAQSIYTNARMPLADHLWQVSHYCQAAINFQFTLELSIGSTPKSFNLVLILLYFIIFQYKIIFLTTKGYENIVSEVVNTLIHMMGQLRYIYPIIMAVLTNHHIEFVHAPVPGILALWGKESRCKKAIQFMKRKLKEQEQEYMTSSSNSQSSNSLLTVVIDMNKHEFIDHSFTHKELFIIENLHNFMKRSNKQNNFFDKMRYFFNEILLNDNPRNPQSQQKWITMLRERLRKTQMYQEYMKYQQTLQKQNHSGRN